MTLWIKSAALGLLVFGLAACASEPADAPADAPAAETPADEPMAEEPMAADLSDAEANCLAAVAEQVGVDAETLSVLSADASEAGTNVMVQVPEAEQPWNCIVDTDGMTVAEVYYMGEG